MTSVQMYPLRFEPIYQYRVWGSRRLAGWLTAPLPGDGPIGEAWLLSDREDHNSKVAAGPLTGWTIRQLLDQFPDQLLGSLAGRFQRFPVLLKFLDVNDTLSVQVHPKDGQPEYLPPGESGKTEAWVVLEAGTSSRIYAGLKPGTTQDNLTQAIARRTIPEVLASFTPKVGDAVLLPAGTVHSLSGLIVFEVQENSDVTYRLYDWDRDDPRTGKPRPLQVEQAFACIDFDQVAIGPTPPEKEPPGQRERLFHCEHFSVWRHEERLPFLVGETCLPRVLVCASGQAELVHDGVSYPVGRGDVVLLPAAVGACFCRPRTAVCLLEVGLPESIAQD